MQAFEITLINTFKSHTYSLGNAIPAAFSLVEHGTVRLDSKWLEAAGTASHN